MGPHKQQQQQQHHYPPRKPPLFPPRKSVKPGDDFYTYINGNWLKHAHMPSFVSSYSVSEEIEDGISAKLFKEIEKSVGGIRTW